MADSSESASGSTDEEVEMVVDPFANKIPEITEWLPEPIQPYWETINAYPIIGAIVVAAFFYIAAFVIRTLLIRSIARLATNTNTDLDDRVIDGLKRPLFNVIFLFGLTVATKTAQLPVGSDLIINILSSLIVVTLMRSAFFITSELLKALGRNHHKFAAIEERTIPLFDLIAKLLIILFGSYTLLMIWGINPVGWLASAGIVGLAVGFAAQDTLANLFAGFFILIDAPYKLRDYVNLDTGERGQVTHIGMRSTRLLTRDDVEITVPNNVMGNAKIINESGGPNEKMRLRIAVGTAYGCDVHQVEKVLEEVARSHTDICEQPFPRVRMRAFGESSLDFELLAWIQQPQDKGRISHELYMHVYDALNAANIEIPFPKRDLYIKEIPAFGGMPS